MTNEQFIEALNRYKTDNQLTKMEVVILMERPRQTVYDWFSKGISRDVARQAIVDAYPKIFSNKSSLEEGNVSPIITKVLSVSQTAPEKRELNQDLKVVINIQIARGHIAAFSDILVWFLFKATNDEREMFRSEIGDNTWTDFQSLIRSMTSETAREVTLDEGRLEKWQQAT